jgi:hypothetical protein
MRKIIRLIGLTSFVFLALQSTCHASKLLSQGSPVYIIPISKEAIINKTQAFKFIKPEDKISKTKKINKKKK